MPPKPKKIVLVSDGSKRFGAEVFDLVRTVLSPKIGGNVNLGVKLAAEYFAPRKPGEVTMVEAEAAIPAITAKFKSETKKQDDNSGRLPLNDEAQKEWDSGKWRGKLTVHGLRQKYSAEIKDGVDLTLSMLDTYAAELAAEKARVAELLDEQQDPAAKKEMISCVFVAHRDEDKQFQPTIAYKLFRNDANQLERQKHSQGDEYIRVGHFLVLKDEDGEITGETAAYCADCRDAARELARNAVDKDGNPAPVKLTFYTWAGAQRVIEAAKKNAEVNVAAMSQIRSAAAKVFGGSGTRSQRDWRTTRRPRGR